MRQRGPGQGTEVEPATKQGQCPGKRAQGAKGLRVTADQSSPARQGHPCAFHLSDRNKSGPVSTAPGVGSQEKPVAPERPLGPGKAARVSPGPLSLRTDQRPPAPHLTEDGQTGWVWGGEGPDGHPSGRARRWSWPTWLLCQGQGPSVFLQDPSSLSKAPTLQGWIWGPSPSPAGESWALGPGIGWRGSQLPARWVGGGKVLTAGSPHPHSPGLLPALPPTPAGPPASSSTSQRKTQAQH